MGAVTQGRRVPSTTEVHELEPGDYFWDGPGSILFGRAPSGDICRVDDRWSIEEHEDGSLTVGPLEPGGKSSIWINRPAGWHGHLQHGVWREV